MSTVQCFVILSISFVFHPRPHSLAQVHWTHRASAVKVNSSTNNKYYRIMLALLSVPFHCMGQIIKLLASSVCRSVCLSVRAPPVANFFRFWWNLCTEVGGPKNNNAFLRCQNPMTPSLILPHFHPRNAFSIGRSKCRSNEVRGPISAVNSSNDVAYWERLQAQSCKMLSPQFLPSKTQKWGTMHFQWEYASLSVWHIISQQRCEIGRWFQRTTYRKLHIRSLMVTWLMTSRALKRSKSWPRLSLKLNISKTVRNRRSVQIDHL